MAKEEKGIFVTHHTPMISTLELINHHTGDMIEIYTNLQAHIQSARYARYKFSIKRER